MITISDAAQKELDAFFDANQDAPKSVRIYLAPGGCCGPALNMALDPATDTDAQEDINGVVYCMAKELFEVTGAISVDISYMGFTITPENPLPSMGGGCSCSGGCGGGCGGGEGGSCCG